MLKKVLLSIVVTAGSLFAAQQATADVYVRGHYRPSGTYVRPHYRSSPDRSFYNNWSTYPNVNPYTSSIGTRRTPSYYRSYKSYRPYSSSSWSSWRR